MNTNICRLFLICIITILLTASCSNSLFKVDISDINDANNHFKYDNLSWGSSIEETESFFSLTLENPLIGTSADESGDQSQNFVLDNSITININNNNYIGTSIFRFKNELLIGIEFSFDISVDESNNILNTLIADFTESFNEPQQISTGEGMSIELPGYINYSWKHEDKTAITVLSVSKITLRNDNSKESVIIDIGYYN